MPHELILHSLSTGYIHWLSMSCLPTVDSAFLRLSFLHCQVFWVTFWSDGGCPRFSSFLRAVPWSWLIRPLVVHYHWWYSCWPIQVDSISVIHCLVERLPLISVLWFCYVMTEAVFVVIWWGQENDVICREKSLERWLGPTMSVMTNHSRGEVLQAT